MPLLLAIGVSIFLAFQPDHQDDSRKNGGNIIPIVDSRPASVIGQKSREETAGIMIESDNSQQTKESKVTELSENDAEELLNMLKGYTDAIKHFDESSLTNNQLYRIVSEVPVLEKYQEKRQRLNELLNDQLPDRLSKVNNIQWDYFLIGAGSEQPATKRLIHLAGKLDELRLSDSNCVQLKKTFGFEFKKDKSKSKLVAFCKSLNDLGDFSTEFKSLRIGEK